MILFLMESVVQAYAKEGHSVFLTGSDVYLTSYDYQMSIGKIGKFECDFIVRDRSQSYAYIQVIYTLQGGDAKATERMKEREYRPFREIRDGYPRYVSSQIHPTVWF